MCKEAAGGGQNPHCDQLLVFPRLGPNDFRKATFSPWLMERQTQIFEILPPGFFPLPCVGWILGSTLTFHVLSPGDFSSKVPHTRMP